MSKKIFTVIIMALLLSLVSCGNGNIGDPYPKDEKQEVTTINNEGNGEAPREDSSKKDTISPSDTTDKAMRDSLKEVKHVVKLTTQQLQERVENLDTIVENHSNELVDIKEANKSAADEIDNCVFCKYGTKAYVASVLILIVFIIIVCKMVIAFSRLSPEEVEKEFDEHFTKCVQSHYIDSNIRELHRNVKSLTERGKDASRRIEQLENQIARINTQPRNFGNSNSQTSSGSSQGLRTQTFYLGAPCEDGKFMDDRNPSGFRFYKFTVDSSNPQKAFFEFFVKDATEMQQVINSRNEIIEWACDPRNNPEIPSSCHAFNSSKGVAILSNGIWTITQKQEVVYG